MDLKDLAYLANEPLPERLESLISIEKDTVISSDGPAHYYRFLYYLASLIKPKTIVEFGTWKGVSAACLSDGCLDSKVITIDIKDMVIGDARRGVIKYRKNTDDVLSDVEEIDLCFIDVEHTYECTMEMVDKVVKRMAKKSIILFDDINLNDQMKDFWSDLNIGGKKIKLPVHGDAGFGAVIFGSY